VRLKVKKEIVSLRNAKNQNKGACVWISLFHRQNKDYNLWNIIWGRSERRTKTIWRIKWTLLSKRLKSKEKKVLLKTSFDKRKARKLTKGRSKNSIKHWKYKNMMKDRNMPSLKRAFRSKNVMFLIFTSIIQDSQPLSKKIELEKIVNRPSNSRSSALILFFSQNPILKSKRRVKCQIPY